MAIPPDEAARRDALFHQFRFVLMETSHPGNVGAAARAIKTMGFGQLVLAAPRLGSDVLQHPEAIALASGADDVLAATRIEPDLPAALTGVNWAVALSARTREYGPPSAVPRDSAALACRHAVRGQQIAFVFGSERAGLSNEAVELCNALVHIPANPAYASLNLSQAVQVIAYEARLACLAEQPSLSGHEPPPGELLASRDEIEGMFAHLESALVALDFLDPANPKRLMTRLRRLFARSGLEHEEVNILRGIAKHILQRQPRK